MTQQRAASLRETGGRVVEDSVSLVKSPQFQVVTLSTAGGAFAVGTVGGAFGCLTGVVVGAGSGLVPACVTFGLSLPLGSAIGGGIGVVTGTVIGVAVGAAAGSTTSYTTYKYRAELRDGFWKTTTTVFDGAAHAKNRVTETATYMGKAVNTKVGEFTTVSQEYACGAAHAVKAYSKEASSKVGTRVLESKDAVIAAVRNPEYQKTAASAVGGAVMLGTAAGAAGTVAGTAVGIAAGIIPALFTCGFSIPVGALIGGSMGLTVGSTAGTSAGFAAGGASYAYRTQIVEAIQRHNFFG